MPWNSGVYTRGYASWTNDANSNLPISATKFDTEDNDFASGLNNCLTIDGLNKPNTAISWGLSAAQVLALTRGSDGAMFQVARTGGSNNPSLTWSAQDAANTVTGTMLGSLILTGGSGLQIGAPAGGGAGSGTINLANVGPYVNGMLRQSSSYNPSASAINASETYVTPAYAIPQNALQVGQVFRITLFGNCTSTVANTVPFKVKCGTLGTTGDADISGGILNVTSTTTGVGAAWKAEIYLQCNANGAACTFGQSWSLLNNSATNGIVAAYAVVGQLGTTGNAPNNATNALKLGVSLTGAAATTLHVFIATIELVV